MSTATSSWLTQHDHADIAFVLLFDGVNLGYTTHSDVSGIQSAWAAVSSWTTIKGGLNFFGALSDEVKPFDAKIQPSSLSFSIQDNDDTLAGWVLREAVNDSTQTELTATLSASGTTATANSVTASAPGTMYIGLEQIAYTGVTGTTYTGLTRGLNSLFGTNSDSSHFGSAHEVDTDTGDAGFRPRITAQPATWYNRAVGLFICHRVNGVWSAGLPGSNSNDAMFYWCGRIKTYSDDGAATIRLDCTSLHELFQTNVLSRQLQGFMQEGMYLSPARASFRVKVNKVTGGAVTHYDSGYVSLPSTGQYRTHAQIASDINNQLSSWFNSASVTFPTTEVMDLRQISTQGGVRYCFLLSDSAATSSQQFQFFVYLNPDVFSLLGWAPSSYSLVANDDTQNNYRVQALASVETTSATAWANQATDAPMKLYHRESDTFDTNGQLQLVLSDVASGTSYAAQPTMPAFANKSATGFLMVGDNHIFAVSQVSSTTYNYFGNVADKIRPLGDFDATTTGTGYLDAIGIRDDGSGDPIVVKQVWIEQGVVGDIFLKLIASTGVNAYNHATYDVYPLGMGIGMPWTSLDSVTFQLLGDDPYTLVLSEPTNFADLFESAMQIHGKHLVWRSDLGQFSVVAEGVDQASATIALTEDNKAKQVTDITTVVTERSTVNRNVNGIVNRLTLKYQRTLDGTYKKTITVNALASQSDFKQTRGVTIEARGIYEGFFATSSGPAIWVNRVVASALAHYSRPTCVLERSYDVSLEPQLYCGARVTITDNAVVDPGSGTRGVTNLLGWVVAKSFDWETGEGKVSVLFFPEVQSSKVGLLAPSARVDDTFTSGLFTRGYDSTNKILKLVANEYSVAGDTVDCARFAVGDKVHIMQLSPSVPGSYNDWNDTIAVVDSANNKLTLTTGLGSPTWAATGAVSGYYVVENQTAANSTNAQTATDAYIADATTLRSNASISRSYYVWGSPMGRPKTATPDYTRRIRRPASNEIAQGQPLSTHKLYDRGAALATLWNHHTVGPLISEQSPSSFINQAIPSAHPIMYGPVCVPLYGAGQRQLLCMLLVSGTNTGGGTNVWTLRTSVAPVTGNSTSYNAGASYIPGYKDGGNACSTLADTSTSKTWITLPTFYPAVVPGEPAYCWITLEANTNANFTAKMHSIFVREVPF